MSKSSDKISYRRAEESDIPGVIELMRAALGEGRIPRTREFWTWKHRENPFGASPMWLAEVDGNPVGVRLFMRWTFTHGSEDVCAVRAVDTATAPAFQGKGIFKKLTLALVNEVQEEGVGFVFNTPNAKSGPGYLKMGWRSHGRTSLWIRARRPLSIARRLLSRGAKEDPPQSNAEPDSTLEPTLRAAMAAGLLDQPPRSAAYQTRLSYTYLLWRYARCPAVSYAAHTADPAECLVVTRARTRSGLSELAVSDLVFRHSRRGVAAATASIQRALRQHASDYAIAAARPSGWEAAALLGCGFLPLPGAGPLLTVRDLARSAPPSPLRPDGLHASVGDLELF